jgi:hypothetical protein
VQIKKLFYWLAALPFVLAASYFFLFPQVWRCQWVSFSAFRQVQPRLYVAPEISKQQQQMATISLKAAQVRIRQMWGGQRGNATVILCHSLPQYQQYCSSGEGAGCSLGTPWGASFVVLNLEGLNTDVIAHEMCHDELFSRLGWWTTKRQIPQWFNEGLALMADRRFVATTDSIQRYIDYKDELLYRSHGGQTVITLDEIATTQGFFGGNETQQMLAYMTAATEVARWLSLVGEQHIAQLIAQIKQGADFEQCYEALEKQAVAKRKTR